MPKAKKRTNVKSLAKTAKTLTPAQARKVKGGNITPGGAQVLMGDGSVRVANIPVGTSNNLLKQKT